MLNTLSLNVVFIAIPETGQLEEKPAGKPEAKK